jgi:class 3 adenylate cyclase/tetratricopeptide (TPR) repeat protein
MGRTCPACGEQNPDRARFCLGCGGQLAVAPPAREQRKLVTIVFADLIGSTAMAERLDPETVRGVMSRYYAAMRAVLERHGGRVEKFIGDAVMAVFGVPVLHEDDALRAVRAARDMRGALAELNRELEARWRIRLQARTGVNTGWVVAGDPAQGHAFISGDAVNVAARLEQVAAAGQILVGETTFGLICDRVHATAVAPLSLKGKAEAVTAYELRETDSEPATAPPGTTRPLIGRETELSALNATYRAVVNERGCWLSCVVGSAGVGKSRLVRTFLDGVDGGALVLEGRCLSYGEGITFWPVVEIIRQAAAITQRDSQARARERLAQLIDGHQDAREVVERIVGLLELGDERASLQEIFWAIRRLLETLASTRPSIVVLDDLQWAEPVLFDLVEYLERSTTGHPVLLLGVARPELSDIRPGFAEAQTMVLQPLGDQHSRALIHSVLGHQYRVSEEIFERVTAAAAGQPLFVVEYVRMLIDRGSLGERDGEWRIAGNEAAMPVPHSIEAVLGSRLDRLLAGELEVLQAAAVIGQEFDHDAVEDLVPPALVADVSAHLGALVDKQLLTRNGHPGVLAFSHLLIRDVAYGRLLKQTRSELHEQFAVWLERSSGQRAVEYDEILGYHLEQAYRYRTELGPADDHARRLAAQARDRLTLAGRRALARENAIAAASLLERAVELYQASDDVSSELLLELAGARADIGQLESAAALVDQVLEVAVGREDPVLRWRARIERVALGFSLASDVRASLAETQAAINALTGLGAERALGRAWTARARNLAVLGHVAGALAAYEQALVFARRHGDRRVLTEALTWILIFVWGGPTPARAGIERCQRVLAEPDVPRQVMACALVEQAPLLAMLGRFGEARDRYTQGAGMLDELGLTLLAAQTTQEISEVEMLAGQPEAAERWLRSGCDRLESMGDHGILASSLPRLGEALYAQGQYQQAEVMAQRGREFMIADDIDAQMRSRRLQAKLLARQEQFAAAEHLAQRAVHLSDTTDIIGERATTLMDLADVLLLAGRAEAAHAAVARALEYFELKENIVDAQRARERLAATEPSQPRGL